MMQDQTHDILAHNQSALGQTGRQQLRMVATCFRSDHRRGPRRPMVGALDAGTLPAHWLGDVRGQRILCLASAGGQQGPVLAAAGAQVTVFDASQGQLEQDRMVAARDGLSSLPCRAICATSPLSRRPLSTSSSTRSRTITCPMCARSGTSFPHPSPGGRMLASFYNPVIFVEDRDPALAAQGLIRPVHTIPYADTRDLAPDRLQAKMEAGEALIFGHSLIDLIAGQIAAGFLIAGFQEDPAPTPRFTIDRYLPTFLATLALKP
jgi:hypothetical protein